MFSVRCQCSLSYLILSDQIKNWKPVTTGKSLSNRGRLGSGYRVAENEGIVASHIGLMIFRTSGINWRLDCQLCVMRSIFVDSEG